MRADTEHRWLPLEQTGDPRQVVAPAGIPYPLRYIREEPTRTLQSEDLLDDQTSARHFLDQLLRAVKVRRGEVLQPPGGISMLPLAEVSLDDRGEGRVL